MRGSERDNSLGCTDDRGRDNDRVGQKVVSRPLLTQLEKSDPDIH